MFTKAFQKISLRLQRRLHLIFTATFVLGLLIGAVLSAKVQNSILPSIYSLCCGRASFIGLMIALLLPLLVSSLAFYFDTPILILPIAFLKAAIYSFCSCSVLFAFGDAGWLVRFLVLFSDGIMLTVLCWYWLRHLDGSRFQLRQNTFFCSLAAVIVCIFDFMYISPFTTMLLQR